jgi:hypothetical protein
VLRQAAGHAGQRFCGVDCSVTQDNAKKGRQDGYTPGSVGEKVDHQGVVLENSAEQTSCLLNPSRWQQCLAGEWLRQKV